MIELVGYFGMFLLLLAWALVTKSKVTSFIISAMGSILVATYAYCLQAWPIVILNIAWLIITIYNLGRIFNEEED